GTETTVEANIRSTEKRKPETVELSKSTRKLVRQKQHVEEITEFRIQLPAKKKPETAVELSKSTKKIIKEGLSADLIELKVPKPRKSLGLEDVPTVAFSKCAIAKCRIQRV